MHNCFSIALSKCSVKCVSVILRQIIPNERLTTVFVDPLQYLSQNECIFKIIDVPCTYFVRRRISKAREK